ncbi:hypothetical protein J7L13_01965, partial [bacterium]|nr:hypothetical protein [bacterium]
RFRLEEELCAHTLLVKTPSCRNRSSSEIHRFGVDACLLKQMVELACRARQDLATRRWVELGLDVQEVWERIKEFTQGEASTPEIEKLITFALQKGAWGAKATGAGGPGACVVIVGSPDVLSALKGVLQQDLSWQGYRVLPFHIDTGLQVRINLRTP